MCAGFYSVGGSSTVIEQLADALINRGHQVTIGALRFKCLPSKGKYKLAKIPISNIFKLRKFLDCFDVIHSHHAITNYLSLMTHKPFIYHFHGAPDRGKLALLRINMLSSIKLTKHRIDAVIAISETAEVELSHYFAPEKVHIIYNGVNTHIFKPNLEAKFRKGKPQFLFVGNLYEHKNVEELIIGFSVLLKAYPRAYLQILGNGFTFKQLKNLVGSLGLENHIELIRGVSGYDLSFYYASCDVYVTSSRCELFGLPLLEAMGCGKPVVASSIPCHIELLTNSQAGALYPAGDVVTLSKRMRTVFEDTEKYRDKAIVFAKEYDWSKVADKVSKLYLKIIQG